MFETVKKNLEANGFTVSVFASGEEAAKSAAFAHAGVSASDAGSIQCKLDEEDGLWVYEVEFRSGGLEYDYEISASDGTVVKAEQDR